MNEILQPINLLTLTSFFVTIAAYWISQKVYLKSARNPLLQPIVIGAAIVIGFLLLTHLSYQRYFRMNQPIHWMMGPATIALAVPLYQNAKAIRSLFLPLLCTIIVGSVITIGSALLLLGFFDTAESTRISMATKSITTPIAMALTDTMGGIASISAVMVIITGALGAIIGLPLMRKLGIKEDAVKGVTLGLTAHAIGTARALEEGHKCGAFSALAMGLTGVLTALVLPWIAPLFL